LDPNLPGRKVFNEAVIAPATIDLGGVLMKASLTGVFDGNGYIISNLTINGANYVGLFGQLGISIRKFSAIF